MAPITGRPGFVSSRRLDIRGSAEAPVDAVAADAADANDPEEEGRSPHHDALFSAFVVVVYMLCGVCFYCGYCGWSVSDTLYFALATITTVGYGDFNGAEDANTIAFTMFYAFFGVGMIGLALGEIVQCIEDMERERERALLKTMTEAITDTSSSNHLGILEAPLTLWQSCVTWSKGGVKRRLLRCMVPAIVLGCVGATILLNTEDPDSPLMTSESPWTAAFYCSIITSLSIGYGKYWPFVPSPPLFRTQHLATNVPFHRTP